MQWVIRSSGPRGLVGEAQLVASIEKPKFFFSETIHKAQQTSMIL